MPVQANLLVHCTPHTPHTLVCNQVTLCCRRCTTRHYSGRCTACTAAGRLGTPTHTPEPTHPSLPPLSHTHPLHVVTTHPPQHQSKVLRRGATHHRMQGAMSDRHPSLVALRGVTLGDPVGPVHTHHLQTHTPTLSLVCVCVSSVTPLLPYRHPHAQASPLTRHTLGTHPGVYRKVTGKGHPKEAGTGTPKGHYTCRQGASHLILQWAATMPLYRSSPMSTSCTSPGQPKRLTPSSPITPAR